MSVQLTNVKSFLRQARLAKGMRRVISNSFDKPDLQLKLLWFNSLVEADGILPEADLYNNYVQVLIAVRSAGFVFTTEEKAEWNNLLATWDLPLDTWGLV